jgi:hypothetical protein
LSAAAVPDPASRTSADRAGSTATVVLASISAIAIAIALWGATAGQSLTNDEPYHIVAGQQMRRHGTNSLNLEHPPLVKWLATLLTGDDRLALPRPLRVGEARAHWDRVFVGPLAAMRRFIVRARAPIVLLVVIPLLALCHRLGSVTAGPRCGLVLTAFFGLSLSTLPYLPLVHTDAAVTLGFVATHLAALAWLRDPRTVTALALGSAFGLALAVKFSGVLLAPAVTCAVLLPLIAAFRARRNRLRVSSSAVLVYAAALFLVVASYRLANTGYDRELGRATISDYAENRGTLVVGDGLRKWEAPLLAVEERSPAIAQYLTGLAGLQVQNAIGIYPSYAFGEIRSEGRWWYFPVLLLVKTPLVVLVLSVVAARRPLVSSAGGAGRSRQAWLPWLIVLTYLAAALTSNVNLGIRHLMPIMPLLFLPAAMWAGANARRALLAVTIVAAESLALHPLWMSATNTWWLGRANPTRLAFSNDNLEYKQSFVALAGAVRERGLEPCGVYYPGATEAEIAAYVEGGRYLRPDDPLAPGWYAVGLHAEQILPAVGRSDPERFFGYRNYSAIAAEWLPQLERIQAGEDHGVVAGGFHLYRLTSPTGW